MSTRLESPCKRARAVALRSSGREWLELADHEDDMKTLAGASLFLLIAGGATLAALADNTLLRVVGAGLVAMAVGYVVAMTLRERKRR